MLDFVHPIAFFGMSFGYGEMLFIFIIILIVFGPEKLPEIFRDISRFMNQMRKASWDFKQQVMEVEHEIKREVREIESTLKKEIEEAGRELDEAGREITDAVDDSLYGGADDLDHHNWHEEGDDYHNYHDEDGNPIYPELDEHHDHEMEMNTATSDPERAADHAASLNGGAGSTDVVEAADEAIRMIDAATGQPQTSSSPQISGAGQPRDIPDMLKLPDPPRKEPDTGTPIARGSSLPEESESESAAS